MAIDNMGMREVWTCGSGDMRADRQTDRHVHHNTPLHHREQSI